MYSVNSPINANGEYISKNENRVDIIIPEKTSDVYMTASFGFAMSTIIGIDKVYVVLG